MGSIGAKGFLNWNRIERDFCKICKMTKDNAFALTDIKFLALEL